MGSGQNVVGVMTQELFLPGENRMTDEFWTDEELIEQKARLLQLVTELEQSLCASQDSSKTVDLDQPIGRLSRMDAIQQQKMAAAARRNTELRLAQIRGALHAIEQGTYGECRRCEEEISKRRLEAKPESPFCIHCQKRAESR